MTDDEKFWHDVEADYLREHPDRADDVIDIRWSVLATAVFFIAAIKVLA